jgi:hypothetical protein
MLLKQYELGRLAPVSYLIADTIGTAVVANPQRDIDPYQHDAARHRCHIRHLFLTHFHTAIAAGLLARHGLTRLVDLLGGVAAWKAASFDVIATAAI